MVKSMTVPVFLLISLLGLPAGLSAQKAVSLFDQFSKVFDDNYAFFQLRGVDWEKQKRTFDGHVSVFGNNKRCNAAESLAWESKSGEIQNFIHRQEFP